MQMIVTPSAMTAGSSVKHRTVRYRVRNSVRLNSAEKPRCMPRPVRMIFRMRSGWRAP